MTPMEKLRVRAITALNNPNPTMPKVTNQPRIMPNGEIHYTQKGKEPPMDVKGYKRKAPKGPDAWKFAPDFPPCRERTISLWQRSCGNVGVHIVCNQTKSACKHEDWNPCPKLSPPA